MPRQMLFRFAGRIEWRYSYALPSVGQVVTSAGESWRVVSVEDDEDTVVCSLEPGESCDADQDTPEGLDTWTALLTDLLGRGRRHLS